ncbi:unnamed protein product [Linum trigynum]|uniref:Reverse transcriptase Ty1/copia-type domain-containing protein n=1 Tax=Linum trigynum TaxID=586398 RepID=A0AAV2DEQ9_9ROSI
MMFFSHRPALPFEFPGGENTLPIFDEEVDDVPVISNEPATPSSTQDLSPPSTDTSPSTTPSSSSHASSSSPIASNEPSPVVQPAPRQSTRSNKGVPPPHFEDYVAHSVDTLVVPTTFKQARGNPIWDRAMQDEFTALEANRTWSVVDRPIPCPPTIGSRWVYAIKVRPDGTVERNRARLVALGYTQEHGVDYNETFAPVAKMSTVRTLLAVAAVYDWPLYQLDVKNAFLHGDLEEVIYMERPPGYTVGREDQVCLLHRSLYGLKQAPRAWFEKFQATIVQLGFQQSLNDPSLFTKVTTAGIVVLLLYVDDMVITGTDSQGITKLKDGLKQAFSIKDLGSLSYFLGLEVSRSDQGILLSQRKYISDLLDDHHFDTCHPVKTPMEVNLKLQKGSGDRLKDGSQYRSIVGSLIYLSATRPDISYAVQVVSQFMTEPCVDHLAAVHRILRYLNGTRDVGILFPATGEPTISAYSDSDFAGCIDTRRSTSGWCVKFSGAYISWRCKKQDKVSKSSTEAEYRAMSEVGSEMVWLRRLLSDFGVLCPAPMTLHVDNTSAIRIAVNPVLHDRTKHIEIHVHYIRDLVRDGTLSLHHLPTEEQVADLFTKAFPTSRHWYLGNKLMLRDRHQFGGGC